MKKILLKFISIFSIPTIITLTFFVFMLMDPHDYFKNATLVDITPLIISIISLWAIIPTFLLNKERDRKLKEYELEKNISLNKQSMKEKWYKSIIPYISLLRHYKHIFIFKNSDLVLSKIYEKYFDDNVVDIRNIERNKDLIAEVNAYCKVKIREVTWYAYLFASREVIDHLKIYNNTTSKNENLQNLFEFEKLINAMRKDLGYSVIDGFDAEKAYFGFYPESNLKSGLNSKSKVKT